jgi:hypothetical protein
VVTENLGSAMCEYHRQIGIFAHDRPVKDVVDCIEALDPDWIHGMHGGSVERGTIPYFLRALRRESVAYQGRLLGRDVLPRESAIGPDPRLASPDTGRFGRRTMRPHCVIGLH